MNFLQIHCEIDDINKGHENAEFRKYLKQLRDENNEKDVKKSKNPFIIYIPYMQKNGGVKVIERKFLFNIGKELNIESIYYFQLKINCKNQTTTDKIINSLTNLKMEELDVENIEFKNGEFSIECEPDGNILYFIIMKISGSYYILSAFTNRTRKHQYEKLKDSILLSYKENNEDIYNYYLNAIFKYNSNEFREYSKYDFNIYEINKKNNDFIHFDPASKDKKIEVDEFIEILRNISQDPLNMNHQESMDVDQDLLNTNHQESMNVDQDPLNMNHQESMDVDQDPLNTNMDEDIIFIEQQKNNFTEAETNEIFRKNISLIEEINSTYENESTIPKQIIEKIKLRSSYENEICNEIQIFGLSCINYYSKDSINLGLRISDEIVFIGEYEIFKSGDNKILKLFINGEIVAHYCLDTKKLNITEKGKFMKKIHEIQQRTENERKIT